MVNLYCGIGGVWISSTSKDVMHIVDQCIEFSFTSISPSTS